MPKAKETQREFNFRMATTFKDVFSVDNSVLFCRICEVNVTAKTLSGVKQHLKTSIHKTKSQRQSAAPQQLISKFSNDAKSGPKLNPIHMDVCELFLETNIPSKKLRYPKMKHFLEKYTKTSPTETTIRKNYVPVVYDGCLDKLRAKAKGKYIWVSLDETTDIEQRLVANFVFGILDDKDGLERGKCYLLDVQQIENHEGSTIAAFFNNCMTLLFPQGKSTNSFIFRHFFSNLNIFHFERNSIWECSPCNNRCCWTNVDSDERSTSVVFEYASCNLLFSRTASTVRIYSR